MQNTVFVALDTETTGLQPGFHQLVEIGAIKFRGDEVLDEYQTLINPERDIPEEVVQIHGIRSDMVADAPRAPEVIPALIEFIGDAPLLAHNAPFDESFISFNLQSIGAEQPENPIYDTLIMTRKLFPELRSHSLANLAVYLDIDEMPAHRAIADVITTIGIFKQCVKKLRSMDIKTWEQFREYYGHPHHFDFNKYNISEILPEEFKGIQGVIERGDMLWIEYIANNSNRTCRAIIPESIFVREQNFYLTAFCHLRCENRLFRLDRVVRFETIPRGTDLSGLKMEG
jgi:DNA polymerase III epsilon subunit family exonuclease